MTDSVKKVEGLIRQYKFDFNNIPKEEIKSLIESAIHKFQPEDSEYLRALCGYLYCIGSKEDVWLLKKAKYEINMDMGCMIDGEWIDLFKQKATAALGHEVGEPEDGYEFIY